MSTRRRAFPLRSKTSRVLCWNIKKKLARSLIRGEKARQRSCEEGEANSISSFLSLTLALLLFPSSSSCSLLSRSPPLPAGPSRRGHRQAQRPQARPGKGPQGSPRGHGGRRRRLLLLEKGRLLHGLGRRGVPRRCRQRPGAPPVLPAVFQDLRRRRRVLRLRPPRLRRQAERDAAVEEALCPGRR